jgi:nucleotide-binding universal stress UspA family protein
MNDFAVTASVMVGVDGSSGGEVALTWAADYAEERGRPLALVHAVGHAVVTDFAIDLAETERGLLAAGQEVTVRARDRVRTDHPTLLVERYDVLGDPRAVLTELAVDASVLVVGSRGRGPVAGLLLGSVSTALATHAPCPVVVVRRPTAVTSAYQVVVVGVGGPGDETEALTFGFELASAHGCSVKVVHALGSAMQFYPDIASLQVPEEAELAADRMLVDALAGYTEKFPAVPVRRRVVHETPTQALVDASRNAFAVVVGCRGRGAARGRLLGSVSRSVVERAHSTVAVVRGNQS